LKDGLYFALLITKDKFILTLSLILVKSQAIMPNI